LGYVKPERLSAFFDFFDEKIEEGAQALSAVVSLNNT